MRLRILIFFLFVVNTLTKAQVVQQTGVANPTIRNTYAVIVGISEYGTGITPLDFAHNDAQVFADYLKSNAGGSVPQENISLLLNKQATQAAIYDALYRLLNTCREDDLVYFYFSGHGDMENTTIHESGFLLSYDTYKVNYINHAVRISDLNDIANTLSVRNKARVILITDACHSGKLAGNENRGTFLVGEQLRTVLKNEVRITSCAPDQLSNEDEGWGGGRGVFSYYLIKGMEGLADYSQDDAVTVNEIKKFLDSCLSSDRLLAEKAQKQTPVINGIGNLKLASVDKQRLMILNQERSQADQAADVILKPLPVQPQSYLFDPIGKRNIEDLVDFNLLNEIPKEQISFAFIDMIKKAAGTVLREEIDTAKMDLLKTTLIENKDALKRFNERLVVLMSDRGQQIINQYLEGDAAELDRRRYYNSEMNRYDIYPKMFSVALKLTPEDNYLHRILKIKLHYFAGVAARLKIPMVENPAPLLSLAMSEQKKALALEENAAFLHNELGILYKLNKDLTAEKYFLRATELAPQWALPWSNLAGLYAQINQYKKGVLAIEKANERQPGFYGTLVNSGVLYEKQGNLLLAEEFLRKSIKKNTRHYLPYERLGYVYMTMTQYDLANTFFYEAEKRKKGYRFRYLDSDIEGLTDQFDKEQVRPCLINWTHVKPNDIMGRFAVGMFELEKKNYTKAEQEFKKVIALDKVNPLAFHYLGKLLYKQKRWKEAEIIFQYAMSYYLDKHVLNKYADSLDQLAPDAASQACIRDKFLRSHYPRIEDRYFLGSIYELWNHYAEAEQQYKEIINAEPTSEGGYYKLWSLYEKIGDYEGAEKILLSFGIHFRDLSDKERNAFYERMTSRFPQNAAWQYKAGMFLYDLLAPDWAHYKWDDYPDNSYRSLLPPDISEGNKDAGQPVKRDKLYLLENEDGIIGNAPHDWVLLPGINEYYIPAAEIDSTSIRSIAYFKKADSLFQDEQILADINSRIGNLYVWFNLPDSAVYYYKKCVGLRPSDAGARKKLVHANIRAFHLNDALVQMDSLYNRNEINFTNQLQMAEYCVHEGRFTDASRLLEEARQIHPYQVPAIDDLSGRLQILSGHPQHAITFYETYITHNTANRPLAMYTIAALNAQLRNTSEAWKWLKLSIENGFRYYWVLKYDKSWDKYRQLEQWKDLTGQIPVPAL